MIKGIDAQVMIQRSVDSGRHASEHANNIAQNQDFMNKLERERAAQSMNTVTQTSETEGRRIERDKREKEQKRESKEERHEGSKDAPKSREVLDDMSKLSVGYGPVSKIDIEV